MDHESRKRSCFMIEKDSFVHQDVYEITKVYEINGPGNTASKYRSRHFKLCADVFV